MSTNFSVIIPIYNGEKYLREAIDSVLKQSMLPKEIILVDDGSTDGSWQICENYKKEYPIIKSVHKKNGGVSSARNLGMEYATGDYIVFLDCDDWLPKKAIATFYECIERNKSPDIVIGGMVQHFNGRVEETIQGIEKEINVKASDFISRIINYNYLNSQVYGNLRSVWAKAIKRIIIQTHQLRFDETLKIGEDMAFLLELSCHCNRVISIPLCVYIYRINAASAMQTYKWDNGTQAKRYMDKVSDICKRFQINISIAAIFFEGSERGWISIINSRRPFKEKYHIFSELADDPDYQNYAHMDNRRYGIMYPLYSIAIRNGWICSWMFLVKIKALKLTHEVGHNI